MRFEQLRIENGELRMGRNVVVLSGAKKIEVLVEVGEYCE